MADHLDRLQQRKRPVGFVLGVLYKYFDDQGGYLAALITYYGFVSMFPLLLLLTTITSFILADRPDLQQQLIDSALSQIPVIGDQLGQQGHLGGGPAGFVIGLLGALYGALGVGQAVQNASNVAWAVPRNERPDPIRSRLRSMVLLGTAGLSLLGVTAISAAGRALGNFGLWTTIGVFVGTVVVNFGVFVLGFRIAVARAVRVKDVAIGSAVAAVFWQLLQTFGYLYVTRVVSRSSNLNGVFAIVLGLLAFIYVAAVLIVLSIEINVVYALRLYPRALMTPFTDDVDLTRGDRRVYTNAAEAQRNKSFQQVDVSFEDHRRDRRPPD